MQKTKISKRKIKTKSMNSVKNYTSDNTNKHDSIGKSDGKNVLTVLRQRINWWDSLKGFKCGNNANWWRMDQLVIQAPNLKFDFGNLAISSGDEGNLCYYEIHR